ncbi:MAG: chromosome partitioning protein ParB [Acidobacteria bacterium]|nr:MAG: chromosome partitioning protein ParB [Acidobacteriota bacterium]
MSRKALGKGLSALLQEVETKPTGVEEIELDLIDPNPLQPRREFPEAALEELAASIRSSGVVQPVLLRRADARYQLVAGERRWRAARLAGLTSVPAVIRDLSDGDALELALTENLMREDLNPLEVARAYEILLQRFYLTHEQIAERLGTTRSNVSNTVRLLKLPSSVQEMIVDGQLSPGHARALIGLDSQAAQARFAGLIVNQGLSVRQVETMVAVHTSKKPPARPKPPAESQTVDPNTRAAVLELERVLGTRVRIVGSERRGRLEISYFSSEDLDRIYNAIVK